MVGQKAGYLCTQEDDNVKICPIALKRFAQVESTAQHRQCVRFKNRLLYNL